MTKIVKKFYNNNKQSIHMISIALFVLFFVAVVKLSDKGDYWYCQNGSWTKQGQPEGNAPTVMCLTPNSKENGPVATVESFYNWYFQSNKTYIRLENVEDTNYFSKNFQKFLSKKPFTGQDNPFQCKYDSTINSFNTYLIYEKNNKAIVSVYQNYIDRQEKLDFVLKKIGDVWQIDSLQCTSLLNATKKLSQSYN